jgi:cell division septum initiation protein DivIVA
VDPCFKNLTLIPRRMQERRLEQAIKELSHKLQGQQHLQDDPNRPISDTQRAIAADERGTVSDGNGEDASMMLVERLTRTMQISAARRPEFFDRNEELNQQDINVIQEQIDSDLGGAHVGLAEVEIAEDTRVLSRRTIQRAENALKTSRLSRETSFPNEGAPRSNTRPESPSRTPSRDASEPSRVHSTTNDGVPEMDEMRIETSDGVSLILCKSTIATVPVNLPSTPIMVCSRCYIL